MRNLLAFCGWSDVPLPPGAWLWADTMGRPVTLATDTGGGQPIGAASNEQRNVHVVLAGGLYNGRQLRSGLAGQHAITGRDDAEVVVHLYEERGINCVKALRGAFAFAIWDERRQRLVIARDQLGLVPLHYATDGHRLAVASALSSLAALPSIAGTWDPGALDTFLTLGSVPPPGSFYTGLRQLRPGELGVWEDGRLRTQRYWQLTFPERRMTRPGVAPFMREQLLEALRLRHAGVVHGLLLSGGIDAAALLALAAAERRLPAATYTAAFPDADEEVRAAAKLAAGAGVEHVPVCDEPDWPEALDGLLAEHGGPVDGADLVAIRMAAARARADVEVVLAGIGGEEVLGGSAPVRAAERVRRYRDLPALAREAAQMWSRFAPSRWTTRLRTVVDAERLAPLEMYARRVSVVLPEERSELYTPDTLATLGDTRPWAALTTLFGEAVSGGAIETLDAIHYVELTLGLPARVAAVSAAASGLEMRLPFADHRLAQIVASIPAAERGTATERQLLLRHALGELLPGPLARRPHAVTLPSARAWTAFLDEILAPERIAAQGVFRPEAVAGLRSEHLSGRRDHTRRLWRIALATRWLERHAVLAIPAVRAAG